jgi:hypothetical protein
MEIVDFKESNVVYAKEQPEYKPLPSYKTEDGTVVSCWKLSWKDKFKILFTGKVWVGILTFNSPLQPQYLSLNKKDFF